jgi:hypothetical protein
MTSTCFSEKTSSLGKQLLSEKAALEASYQAQLAVRNHALVDLHRNTRKAKVDDVKPDQSQHRHNDSMLPPKDFLYPLSLCLMKDPWTTQVGATYEKEEIEKWLGTNKTDPKTNQKLKSIDLIPNYALKGLIQQWRDDHPRYSD